MIVHYSKKKLQKICTSRSETEKAFGSVVAKVLRERLALLSAASNLSEISHLPPSYCHQLTGGLKGSYSVRLPNGFRIVFRPNHSPVPLTRNNEIDRKAVTDILITDVCDYH